VLFVVVYVMFVMVVWGVRMVLLVFWWWCVCVVWSCTFVGVGYTVLAFRLANCLCFRVFQLVNMMDPRYRRANVNVANSERGWRQRPN
jgi:hypothetical protein